jgi:restriction endonuclease Mrr
MVYMAIEGSTVMPTKDEIQNFSLMLREYAAHKGLGLWDALVHYCSTSGMESELAASLLTASVLEDIAVEVRDLNLLKERGGKPGRLPI